MWHYPLRAKPAPMDIQVFRLLSLLIKLDLNPPGGDSVLRDHWEKMMEIVKFYEVIDE